MIDDKILLKLDKIEDRQQDHTEQLIKYNIILEHHVKRTELLEHAVTIMEDRINPIETHVKLTALLFKIAVAGVSAIGAIIGLVKLVSR